MSVLHSLTDPKSPAFGDNNAFHRGLAETLRTELARARRGGDERSHARHTEQGKLFVRELC